MFATLDLEGYRMSIRRWILVTAILLVSGISTGATVTDLRDGQEGSISYPSSVESVTLTGELQFPKGTADKFPAIVIAHGSGGVDWRTRRWAGVFQEHGIATFTIDYFGPRGVYEKSATQPIPVHDTFDALNLLATHPRIDPKRIAIIGFSRGGHLAWESANGRKGASDVAPRYAAHISLYPSCNVLGVVPGDSSPVMLQLGALDVVVPVVQCEILAERSRERGARITLKVYEGAYHGWDGDYTGDYFQRSINRTYRLQSDAAVTRQSRADAIEFLTPLIGPFGPPASR